MNRLVLSTSPDPASAPRSALPAGSHLLISHPPPTTPQLRHHPPPRFLITPITICRSALTVPRLWCRLRLSLSLCKARAHSWRPIHIWGAGSQMDSRPRGCGASVRSGVGGRGQARGVGGGGEAPPGGRIRTLTQALPQGRLLWLLHAAGGAGRQPRPGTGNTQAELLGA